MSDPEQGWRWYAYLAGRCLSNLPRIVRDPRPVVDALINLEAAIKWPAEIRSWFPSQSLTLAERLFLRWLCQGRQGQSAFEFGTGTGSTAALLASCGLKVWSLDVESRANVCCDPGIHLLDGDSKIFDFSPYLGTMDVVFIDGGHDYETVLADTISAYALRKPGGVIVWHDCNVQHPDVWRFLLALRKVRRIHRVEGTRLALDGPWERP